MQENDKKETLPPITEQVREYVETYIRLARLKAIDRGTSIFAGIVTDVFVILGLALTLLFASITLALYLASVLHSWWAGFGCVTLLYVISIFIVMIWRKNLQRPIVNALIKRIIK